MQSLTWRILNSNSVVTEIKHSLIPCRIIWIWLNNIWVTHCVCRSESRIISEIDPLCFQVKSSHVQSFLKNALTAQLIQQQDDKGETPSVFSASSCGCSGVFWPRRALLSRIVVCAHCVPPERQNVAMSRKNHTHFFQQRDGVDEMFTHQTKLRCYGAAVAAEQRRSLCEWNTAVRACVRACVLRWKQWCCEMDNSSSLFRPSRCDGYASYSSSGAEICMNQCLFWVN